MIIVNLQAEPRKKGYVRVTVEPQDEAELRQIEELQEEDTTSGAHEILVSEEVRYRRGLTAGYRITLEELSLLIHEDDLVKAKDVALSMLDYRMRTRKEVREKLTEKGFSADVAQKTMESLEEYGFLDDEKYAQAYLKDRIRQRGARTIGQELAQKGIGREMAEELLEGFGDEEEEAALAACRKKYQNLKSRGLDEQKIREKVYRFLMSRGYDYSLIKKVYNRALEDTED